MRLFIAATMALGLATALPAAFDQNSPGQEIQDNIIQNDGFPRKLSDYGFFDGGALRPSPNLIPYKLRSPLFSDYAEKQRFIHLPKNGSIITLNDGRLEFPIGTALIKSFGYNNGDAGKLNILETRLLLRRESGWVALPYVWREDGSDADLKVGGKRIPVSFMSPRGKAMEISYSVPNKNQCKQCHNKNGVLNPIGPAIQDMMFMDAALTISLLSRLSNLPKHRPMDRVMWTDTSAPLQERAASYLYGNCAHCHNPNGSASNSGLFYDKGLSKDAASGYKKRPVAAGRGSGGHEFVVNPAYPEKSILLHRMKSLDPGVAMPELGRATVHIEGVELLEEWIKSMPKDEGS